MTLTTIEWTHAPGYVGATWNPVTGCTKVSPGCAYCYAETIAKRFHRNGGSYLPGKAEIICHPERLEIPLKRKKPTMCFVNSMSDLFHEDVPFEFIAGVFAVMGASQRHTFQILTKRPERALAWFEWFPSHYTGPRRTDLEQRSTPYLRRALKDAPEVPWPFPNVWLGVSVENQYWAEKRIPLLLQTPAAVRFLSCEPLLKALDLRQWTSDWGYESGGPQGWVTESSPLDWVIVGGESGPKARVCAGGIEEAMRSLKDRLYWANVPFFAKQMGAAWAKAHGIKGKADNIDDFPEDLQVREWPKVLKAAVAVQ